jgi:hypothetical protein
MKPLKAANPTQVHQWERGWIEHERMQLQRLAALSFAEKLAWLEKSHHLVIQLEAARSSHVGNPASRKQ